MVKKSTLLYIVVGVVLVALGYTLFGGKRAVQGFQNPTEPTFTMYFAPWCGHCKKAKPEFDEFAKNGHVMIGDKRCVVRSVDPEQQPAEAKGKPIRGFPTFLLELPNGVIQEYKGDRSAAAYLEFLNKQLGGGI
jgi:thiol-disulfide isomerase/thioredoxin